MSVAALKLRQRNSAFSFTGSHVALQGAIWLGRVRCYKHRAQPVRFVVTSFVIRSAGDFACAFLFSLQKQFYRIRICLPEQAFYGVYSL